MFAGLFRQTPVILTRLFAGLALMAAAPCLAVADNAAYDLPGPTLEVEITHAGLTLPISQTPALAAGDQLAIKPDLSSDQSVRYLLVVAFLRGATNPPPQNWFFSAPAWTAEGRRGLKIVVPNGAQQAVIFLAPKTGGDFATLVGAVRGRPGAFVLAAQDLNQAFLDRARLEAYLVAIRRRAQLDPKQLASESGLLSRSLAIKVNPDCLDKIPALQAACLSASQGSLVLDDGHETSVAHTLTSGDSSDLISELSVSPKADYGYYSPYIGAMMDIVRELDSLHTAQYQYIPALALARGDKLALMLNAAPSFHAPLSVLVAALPPVGGPPPPALSPVGEPQAYCLEQPNLVLPVDGAPAAFSTDYAQRLELRLRAANGDTTRIPAALDAAQGGLVLRGAAGQIPSLDGDVDATLQGEWGFAPFEGPHFDLQAPHRQDWTLASPDPGALAVGRATVIRLRGRAAPCVDKVQLTSASGSTVNLVWKRDDSGVIQVALPLDQVQPGPITLLVGQFGLAAPDAVRLRAYAEPARLDGFDIHSGDAYGLLKGARLDEVSSLSLDGINFSPSAPVAGDGPDVARLVAADAGGAGKLKPSQTAIAKVKLADGRSLDIAVEVAAPRPSVALIGLSEAVAPRAAGAAIAIKNAQEVPAGAVLTFAVRAQSPSAFKGDEMIQVAPVNGVGGTLLTFADGLVLQDAHVMVARLDTAKAFNASTFGPLQYRLIAGGADSDWRPLATLVRLPTITAVKCSAGGRRSCSLTGSDLFLVDSVSAGPRFTHAVSVPEGFTGDSITVPMSGSGRLYVKLRDAPDTIDSVALPMTRRTDGEPRTLSPPNPDDQGGGAPAADGVAPPARLAKAGG